MKLRTGVDLIEIERIRKAIERNGDRFLNRVFTPDECLECADRLPSLAARWAAKEAVGKAFGTGIGDMSFQEIEVRRGTRGDPVLHLHGAAKKMAAEQGLAQWSVSLSHTETHAIAMVVALGSENEEI